MFEKLTELAAPQHRELAEFLQGCSTDASTRTMATTALVLTLWQMAGRHMTLQLPSMLLINASDAADPIELTGETNGSYPSARIFREYGGFFSSKFTSNCPSEMRWVEPVCQR